MREHFIIQHKFFYFSSTVNCIIDLKANKKSLKFLGLGQKSGIFRSQIN